jgi:3-deoxy-D-manno-octulosonate 8-phosphate phosphatase (KDO 8-P phosphatase)
MMRVDPKWIEFIKLLVFDFDGVFTDNRVWVFEDGSEAVCCSRADGLGLKKLRELGLEMLILSTEENPVVQARAKKLQLLCIQGVSDKLKCLQKLMNERSLSFMQVAYVGNDINDQECLEQVGYPIVISDSQPEVLHLGTSVTTRAGGQGAVREICDAWSKAIKLRKSYEI